MLPDDIVLVRSIISAFSNLSACTVANAKTSGCFVVCFSIALKEGLKRGWFSYTDLHLLLDDPRIQLSMSDVGLEWLKVGHCVGPRREAVGFFGQRSPTDLKITG